MDDDDGVDTSRHGAGHRFEIGAQRGRVDVVQSNADAGAVASTLTTLAMIGAAGALLTAERTALNFLGRLSGVATATARVVQAVRAAGGAAQILDTRKTTPGLRALEKRAVADGGGVNHRAGLYDAILIKENHSRMAGGVGA